MKKSPKTFETSKPRIIIIIIIISGFLFFYFLGEGMISSVSTGYVSRPLTPNLNFASALSSERQTNYRNLSIRKDIFLCYHFLITRYEPDVFSQLTFLFLVFVAAENRSQPLKYVASDISWLYPESVLKSRITTCTVWESLSVSPRIFPLLRRINLCHPE